MEGVIWWLLLLQEFIIAILDGLGKENVVAIFSLGFVMKLN
jgi:hypothetical protein